MKRTIMILLAVLGFVQEQTWVGTNDTLVADYRGSD